MSNWLLAVAFLVATFAVLDGTGTLIVRRYCASHVVAQVAVAGHGLRLRLTVDESCWRLRLRSCRRSCDERAGLGDPPSDIAVREPRRPLGPGPVAGALELDPPL